MNDDGIVEAFAPGRVNLIGDHTDTTGGFVLPMAIDLGTTIVAKRGHRRVVLASADGDGVAEIALDIDDARSIEPEWARYVAGVVAELRPTTGLIGEARTTLPLGRGLASSAALEAAAALALLGPGGAAGIDRVALAGSLQRAEHRASGVPCGIMDQLATLCGVPGHALLIDCTTHDLTPVEIPAALDVVVIDSGVRRELRSSAYGERRAELAAAEAVAGPLRTASAGDLDRIDDAVVRQRARHVITENARVRAFAVALLSEDLPAAGELMYASHASLRDDFACSAPEVDDLVDHLRTTRGVYGARVTGAGWGGCVVALTEPGALEQGWRVRPWGGATVAPGAST